MDDTQERPDNNFGGQNERRDFEAGGRFDNAESNIRNSTKQRLIDLRKSNSATNSSVKYSIRKNEDGNIKLKHDDFEDVYSSYRMHTGVRKWEKSF